MCQQQNRIIIRQWISSAIKTCHGVIIKAEKDWRGLGRPQVAMHSQLPRFLVGLIDSICIFCNFLTFSCTWSYCLLVSQLLALEIARLRAERYFRENILNIAVHQNDRLVSGMTYASTVEWDVKL